MLKNFFLRRSWMFFISFILFVNIAMWFLMDIEKDSIIQQELPLTNPLILPNLTETSLKKMNLNPSLDNNDLNYTSYLPATVSVIVKFYASTRDQNSLSMMLPPQVYQKMNCFKLRDQHQIEYNTVIKRINFTEGPKFSVPGFFYNPFPLCGRYLLSYFTNSKFPYLFVLRVNEFTTISSNNSFSVIAGQWSEDVIIEQCGECLEVKTNEKGKNPCDIDVLFMARLLSDNRVLHADILPSKVTSNGENSVVKRIGFVISDPGEYILEVKMVHVNGTNDDFIVPKTLGIIGTRATVNGRKAFLYGDICDIQRNVYGSPLRVHVLPKPIISKNIIPPFCNISLNYNTTEGGQWVRFIDGAKPDTPEGAIHPLVANCSSSDRYCHGDPISLTDACGHNNHLVWVPSTCRLRIFPMRSGGPVSGCLRTTPLKTKMAYLLLVGDSVIREYKSNCDELGLGQRGSNLKCVFANIAPEAKYFSPGYALSVVRVIIENIKRTKPLGAFVTNLGIQHMIGRATTSQWITFIDFFVEEWRKENLTVLRGPYTTMPTFGAPKRVEKEETKTSEWHQYMWEQNKRSLNIMNCTEKDSTHCLFSSYMEWAIWLSPPTVHYARLGMTHQREMLWDHLAYERLKKIGFIRIDTMTPTLSRQEGTWDGLHQLSQFNKVQSPWRNRNAAPRKFNGGVSFMLFLILINVICFS